MNPPKNGVVRLAHYALPPPFFHFDVLRARIVSKQKYIERKIFH